MQQISSVNNATIKKLAKLKQKKYRDEENRYLIEGFHLFEEAVKAAEKAKAETAKKAQRVKEAQAKIKAEKAALTQKAESKKTADCTLRGCAYGYSAACNSCESSSYAEV